VEASLAHPGALVAYIVARLLMAQFLPATTVTVILSDFANVMLILIAAAQYRKARTMEREIDGIAEATDGVDHEAIRAETA
jgi:hypothetical protein